VNLAPVSFNKIAIMTQNNIREVLAKHPVIPVVTLNNAGEVDDVAKKLISQNIFCAEVTLRTPFAMEGIALMKSKYPEISVGVGTVVNPQQVEELIVLKPDFLVSPGHSEALVSAMEASKISYLPGVATPSEIIQGMELGLRTFKLFPASLFGGLEALKAYGQVFQQCKFCPTGGLNAENHKTYLALDNVISVGGSWMLR
jgi:2-dehydro-3-deoxyphosphogluconate aldolase/(4S)-4-hydroxy-2-oxoglutarate aldolase